MNKRKIVNVVAEVLKYAILIAGAIFTLLPFLWMIMNSLKSNGEFFENWNSFPSRLKFENYADAFEKINYNDTNLIGMFFNSVILTVENTLAAVIFPLTSSPNTLINSVNSFTGLRLWYRFCLR